MRREGWDCGWVDGCFYREPMRVGVLEGQGPVEGLLGGPSWEETSKMCSQRVQQRGPLKPTLSGIEQSRCLNWAIALRSRLDRRECIRVEGRR